VIPRVALSPGGVARTFLICQARLKPPTELEVQLRFSWTADEGSAMQARMATYKFSGDDAHALARRAEEGILPILEAQPGFKAYTVAIGDGEVLSLSVWNTRADAETGSEVVASWVAENMAGEIELNDVRYAEIMLSTTLGISTSAAGTS